VSDKAFIFMLALGMTVLIGILTVAHVSAYRLKKRIELRRQTQALAPDVGNVMQPSPNLSAGSVSGDPEILGQRVSVQTRRAEIARQS
jgi:hypothetical protein